MHSVKKRVCDTKCCEIVIFDIEIVVHGCDIFFLLICLPVTPGQRRGGVWWGQGQSHISTRGTFVRAQTGSSARFHFQTHAPARVETRPFSHFHGTAAKEISSELKMPTATIIL